MSSQSLESDHSRVNSMPDATTVAADWALLLEQATSEVFSMMLGCEVETLGGQYSSELGNVSPSDGVARPALIEVLFRREPSTPRDHDVEVTAVVGIAGELCGVFKFSCGTMAARMLAARLLGVDEANAGDQQWDAIGEMCNMIGGNFKSKLPGIGERCMLSVPTIVVGSNYRLHTVAGKRKLEYRFAVAGAPLQIALELQK